MDDSGNFLLESLNGCWQIAGGMGKSGKDLDMCEKMVEGKGICDGRWEVSAEERESREGGTMGN
jgi:hypothetical protein